MRHRLYIHLVWTTRQREPSLDLWAAEFLSDYLARVVRQERCYLLALGIVRSHLHLLIAVHPTTPLPKLVQRLKGGSATVSNREGHGQKAVRWAKGYNIETVSPKALAAAREYVANQSAHHPDEAIRGWTGFVHSQEVDAEEAGGHRPPPPSSGYEPLENDSEETPTPDADSGSVSGE